VGIIGTTTREKQQKQTPRPKLKEKRKKNERKKDPKNWTRKTALPERENALPRNE
jgi:hypothetical protein